MRPEGSRPGRLLRRAAPLLVALVLGAVIARATAPSPPAPTPVRVSAPSPSGARTLAGVPVSFPETPAGAAAAAAAYQRAFAGPQVLRPGALRARVRVVATPDYAAKMLEANGPGLERLAAGPIGVGIAHGLGTLYTAVPIGYRVLGYEPGRAQIETWGLTLLGNAGAVQPAAWFGLSHTELAWVGGRWRIAATESAFGPTPRLATKPGPLGGYDVLGLARSLHAYVLAP
ncbi:MAG: hypothetical protein AB7V58_04920 [Solirubrobacterales bacterium]